MAQLLRVQNFNVSRDGFGAGENQSFERPFGHADPGDMFAWAGATASWPNRTDPGGSRGLDDYFTRDFANTSALRLWAATSSAHCAAHGATTNGRAGATSRRSTLRYSVRPRQRPLQSFQCPRYRHDAPRAPVVHLV